MHPNPAFRDTETETNLAFARNRGFGVLTTNGDIGPLVSHIPFLVSDDGQHVDLHLVRSNPISRACRGDLPAVLAVTGAHSYISPDWYGADNMVPTWNYVAVHLRGVLSPLPDDDLHPMLVALSSHFESQLEKPPWLIDKVEPDSLARMLRQIKPFRLTIKDVQGTWKLGQNKDDAARMAAAAYVATDGIGDGLEELAQLMAKGSAP